MNAIASESTASILVIEDEPDLRDAVVSFLNLEGFAAIGTGKLAGADQWLQSHRFDLIVLDLGLPDGDGIAWLNKRQDLVDKGIIIVTARDDADDRLIGARAGNDAYLVKPVLLEELALTASRLAARIKGPRTQTQWLLQPLTWQLRSPRGERIKLTGSEIRLMSCLCSKPGLVTSRDELITALGKDPAIYDPRRLEILIRRLRQKARDAFGAELPLESVYGEGLSFVAPVRIEE